MFKSINSGLTLPAPTNQHLSIPRTPDVTPGAQKDLVHDV